MQPTHPRGGTDLMARIVELRASIKLHQYGSVAVVDTSRVAVIMTFCAIAAEISY